jgi:putative flippase GtrA
MTGLIQKIKDARSRNAGIFQFIKFGLTGVVGAAFDFSIFALLHSYFDWYYLYANFVSVFVAICVTFVLNKTWTFRAKGKENLRNQTTKFFTVAISNYFLQQLLLYLIVTYSGIGNLLGSYHDYEELVSKVIAICIVMFSNFFLNKFWTFRDVANQKVSVE